MNSRNGCAVSRNEDFQHNFRPRNSRLTKLLLFLRSLRGETRTVDIQIEPMIVWPYSTYTTGNCRVVLYSRSGGASTRIRQLLSLLKLFALSMSKSFLFGYLMATIMAAYKDSLMADNR